MKIQSELKLFHWGVIIFQHNPTAPWRTFLIFARFLQLPQNAVPHNSTADKHTCHSNSQCSCPFLLWPMLIAPATVLLVTSPDKLTFITLVSLRSLSAAGNTQYVCQLHTPSTSHLVIPVSCSPFTVITLHICYIRFRTMLQVHLKRWGGPNIVASSWSWNLNKCIVSETMPWHCCYPCQTWWQWLPVPHCGRHQEQL